MIEHRGQGPGVSEKRTGQFRSYQDLKVWQKGVDLVVECYKLAKGFPKDEVFGLVSQIRRAAVSIPANIAEGHARQHTREFLQHLSIAYASLAELETHFLIARKLGYVESTEVTRLMSNTSEIGRMLNGLKKSLRSGIADDQSS